MNRQELFEYEAGKKWLMPEDKTSTAASIQKLRHEAFISGAQFADSLDRWVKVEDGLPVECDEVLVWVKYRKEVSIGIYDSGIWEKSDPFGTQIEVTHWQPLPEAPTTK